MASSYQYIRPIKINWGKSLSLGPLRMIDEGSNTSIKALKLSIKVDTFFLKLASICETLYF